MTEALSADAQVVDTPYVGAHEAGESTTQPEQEQFNEVQFILDDLSGRITNLTLENALLKAKLAAIGASQQRPE